MEAYSGQLRYGCRQHRSVPFRPVKIVICFVSALTVAGGFAPTPPQVREALNLLPQVKGPEVFRPQRVQGQNPWPKIRDRSALRWGLPLLRRQGVFAGFGEGCAAFATEFVHLADMGFEFDRGCERFLDGGGLARLGGG